MDWGLVSPTGQEHRLKRSMMFVGREDCEVVIKSKTVDKQHSVLNYDPFDDVFTVKDLGSVNGTFVNETRIPDHTYINLQRGDTVRFGYDVTTYRFEQLKEPVPSPTEASRRRNVFEIDIDKYFNQYKKTSALGSNRESSVSHYYDSNQTKGDLISRDYRKLNDRDNTSAAMSNQQRDNNHYGAASSKWESKPGYSFFENSRNASDQSVEAGVNKYDSEIRRSQSETFANKGGRKSGDPSASFKLAKSNEAMDRPDSLNLQRSEKDIPVTFYHKRADKPRSGEDMLGGEKLDRSGELTVKSKGSKHTSFTIEFKDDGETSPTKRSIHDNLSKHVPHQVKKKIVENGKLVEDLRSERRTKKTDDPEEEPGRKENPAQAPSKRQQDSLAYPAKNRLAGKSEGNQLANGSKSVENEPSEIKDEQLRRRRQSDSDSEELVNRMFGGSSQAASRPSRQTALSGKPQGPQGPSSKPAPPTASSGKPSISKSGGKKSKQPEEVNQHHKEKEGEDEKDQENLSESGTYTIDADDVDEEEARRKIDQVFGVTNEEPKAPSQRPPESLSVKRPKDGSLAVESAGRQSQRSATHSDSTQQQSKGTGRSTGRSQVSSSRSTGTTASESSQKSSKSSKSSSQKSVVTMEKTNRTPEHTRKEADKTEAAGGPGGVQPGDAQWVSEWASRQAARLSQEGDVATPLTTGRNHGEAEVRRPPIGRSPVNLVTSDSMGRRTPKGKRLLPPTPSESRGGPARDVAGGGDSSRSVVSDVMSSGSRKKLPNERKAQRRQEAEEAGWDARSLDTDILLQDTTTVMAALKSKGGEKPLLPKQKHRSSPPEVPPADSHNGSLASSLDSDLDTASSTVSGSEVNRARAARVKGPRVGSEPALTGGAAVGAKPSTVWTRLSQPNKYKVSPAVAKHTRSNSAASDTLSDLAEPGRNSPDLGLTSSRRSRTSPVPSIQPRQTRATSLRKSFNVGRDSPTESSLSEAGPKGRMAAGRRSEVTRPKGTADTARSGVSLGEEIVRRSRSQVAAKSSSRARSSSADRLPKTETATSLARVPRPGLEVKRSQSFKKRSAGAGNVWRRYDNTTTTASDTEPSPRLSSRRSDVSTSSAGSSDNGLLTSDPESDLLASGGAGHADEIARMSSNMARDLEQLTRGTRIFDTSGIKKEDTVLDDIFSEETISTGRSETTSTTLDTDTSKSTASTLVDRKLGERLASSPNLALKKDPSSKKEAFDSLVLSSIYHLSVKLRKNANSISSKVKYLYKTDDLDGGQSSTDRDAPLLKTANKEIAGILLNLRKIEKQLEDIDKTIDPHGNIQGVSQLSGEREERKEYIREMQWKHRELGGRRNSWQGGSLDSYDSPSPSDDGQF